LIVIDASALVDVLLRRPAAEAIERRLFAIGGTALAPHIIDLETAHVIRRFVHKGEMTAERGELALARLANFPLVRLPHTSLLPRIWALRNNLSAYDAAYVALSEALHAPLLTRDRRLASAAGHSAAVELI
jgi:predicted nucleic acid-binding protein